MSAGQNKTFEYKFYYCGLKDDEAEDKNAFETKAVRAYVGIGGTQRSRFAWNLSFLLQNHFVTQVYHCFSCRHFHNFPTIFSSTCLAHRLQAVSHQTGSLYSLSSVRNGLDTSVHIIFNNLPKQFGRNDCRRVLCSARHTVAVHRAERNDAWESKWRVGLVWELAADHSAPGTRQALKLRPAPGFTLRLMARSLQTFIADNRLCFYGLIRFV